MLIIPPDRPDFWRTNLPKFQVHLESGLPSSPGLRNEVASEACVKELSSAFSKALTALPSVPNVLPTALIIGSYSGSNTSEEPVKGAVADHEAPYFKS